MKHSASTHHPTIHPSTIFQSAAHGPGYLSWVVKQPLLPGFVLIAHHGLRHLVADGGAHGAQHPVQPHLHLPQKNTQRGRKLQCVSHEHQCVSYRGTLMSSLISIKVESGRSSGIEGDLWALSSKPPEAKTNTINVSDIWIHEKRWHLNNRLLPARCSRRAD